MPIAAFGVASLAIALFGTVDLSQDAVEHIMRQRIPNAAEKHGLWSGYYEIASTVNQNTAGSIGYFWLNLGEGIVYLFVPLLYVVILCARLISYAKNKLDSLLVLGAVLVPLLIVLFAVDWYRWIGMSANMALLLSLVFVSQSKRAASPYNLPLVLFGALAPLGHYGFERPFPVHQFVLEKILALW